MSTASEIRKRLRDEARAEQNRRELLVLAVGRALDRVERAEAEANLAREAARRVVAAAGRHAGGLASVAHALDVDASQLGALARGVSPQDADREADAIVAAASNAGNSGPCRRRSDAASVGASVSPDGGGDGVRALGHE